MVKLGLRWEINGTKFCCQIKFSCSLSYCQSECMLAIVDGCFNVICGINNCVGESMQIYIKAGLL